MENIPPFENARLLELERLRLLDRPSDQDIEDVLELCRIMTDSGVCALNLITDTHQIEKFSSGKRLGNIKREDSFCQFVVKDNKPLFVENASADARFKKSRHVKGKPGILAYGGVPIHGANKLPLGALCVIDTHIRPFRDNDKKILELASKILRRRLIPEVTPETTDELPTLISSGEEFTERFNTMLCETRRSSESRTVLFYFQDAQAIAHDSHSDQRTVFEVRRIMIDRLATVAKKSKTAVEGGIMGVGQFALALKSQLPEKDMQKLANFIVASLNQPVPTKTGHMAPKITVSIFTDNETMHDPNEIINLCQFIQDYTHMSKPDVMMLTALRVKQAMRLSVGRTRIAQAIKDKQISLAFQPVVNANDRSLNGFEALVRWKEPELGAFSALEILELCEIEGLNESLDYAVMEMALACAAQRQVATGEKTRIAINIDVSSLISPQFVRKAKKIIALSKFDPQLIEIELTEHSIIDDPDNVIRKMGFLIDIGVSFVLDDFGTGFSSLTHLHKLPVKKIKIDRSFVSKIGDKRSATLVQSIISTARLLDMETTGEGAETDEHMIVLNALGCTHIQGYYVSKPLNLKNYLKPFAVPAREQIA